MAWALVQRGTSPPQTEKIARQIYFPLTSSYTDFEGPHPKRLPGIDAADRRIVQRSQPYKRGRPRELRIAFGELSRLSNHGKHRTVQPAFAHTASARVLDISESTDCTYDRVVPLIKVGAPLKVGTKLGYVYVTDPGPNPQIKVGGQIPADVSIGERVWLGEWCDQTGQLVARLLTKFWTRPQTPEGVLGIGPSRHPGCQQVDRAVGGEVRFSPASRRIVRRICP